MIKVTKTLILTTIIILAINWVEINAAAYSFPNRLINIPIGKKVEKGYFELGTSIAMAENKDVEVDHDFMLNYAPINRVIAGITFYKPDSIVGNIQVNFIELDRFVAAGGILNITSAEKTQVSQQYGFLKESNNSSYVTTSLKLGKFTIHWGMGLGRFKHEQALESATLEQINGMFYGLEYRFWKSKLITEFDGKNTNIGFQFPFFRNGEVHIALTELDSKKLNAEYDNSSKRFMTLAFVFKENMLNPFHKRGKVKKQLETKVIIEKPDVTDIDKLKKELFRELKIVKRQRGELEKDINNLKSALKREQRYLFDQNMKSRDQKHRKYLGVNSILGEKVIKLYYNSFEYYYQGEYGKAIEAVSKAIIIDPYIPLLYVRLGGIYKELGLEKEAIENWTKALFLDPTNEELQEELKNYEFKVEEGVLDRQNIKEEMKKIMEPEFQNFPIN